MRDGSEGSVPHNGIFPMLQATLQKKNLRLCGTVTDTLNRGAGISTNRRTFRRLDTIATAEGSGGNPPSLTH